MAAIFSFFITFICLLSRINKPLLVYLSVGLSADHLSPISLHSNATCPTCPAGHVIHILRLNVFLSSAGSLRGERRRRRRRNRRRIKRTWRRELRFSEPHRSPEANRRGASELTHKVRLTHTHTHTHRHTHSNLQTHRHTHIPTYRHTHTHE